MTVEERRAYYRTYMAEYRANGCHPIRGRMRRLVVKRPPRVFMPLAEQRHGHCCWCGIRSLATTCGFCLAELEGRPLPRCA